MLKRLNSIIGKAIGGLLLVTRPLLGPSPSCRFELTCTTFFIQQFAQLPLHKALFNSIKRLCSCHPFTVITRTRFEK